MYSLYNGDKTGEKSEDFNLNNVFPELKGKLESIQNFLLKVRIEKSLEKIREKLPLLGFFDGNIEYNFGDFCVRFSLEKCCNDSKNLMFNSSEIRKRLADNLMENSANDQI